MKHLYIICCVFSLLISYCFAPSAILASGLPSDNGTKSIILSEDFEGGTLPSGWSNEYGAATFGWLFGTNLSSAFWNIPAHTTYACVNDDSCNCDMMNVNLTSSSFNNSMAGAVLEFDYLSYSSSDVSEVQISIDGGVTFTTLETLTGSGGVWIDNYAIDLSAYLSSDVRIRFHYSDGGGWAWGFCIDNFEVSSPGGDDLAVTGINNNMVSVGEIINPSVIIRNTGTNVASSYSVNLRIKFGITEVYNENMTFIAQPLAPATDKNVVFTVPLTIASAGTYELKATVIMANDINPMNDCDSATMTALSIPPYNDFAYAVNINKKSFCAVDLNNGDLDSISTFDVTDFPMCLEFIENALYVFRISGNVDVVYSDGTIMPIGTISGMPSSPMAATYCELDEKTYLIGFNDTVSALYELDMNTLQATQVGVVGNGVFIAIEATEVGAIYGVNISDDKLYTIDRLSGTSTLIGSSGLNLSYGQDISWNSNTGILYGMLFDETQGGIFGTFDTSNGSFTSIAVPGDQIAAFAVNSAWTGIAESDFFSTLIYPNPADNKLFISLENVNTIRIYNNIGEMIVEYNTTGIIDTSFLPDGMYIVEVTTENSTFSDKIIITH